MLTILINLLHIIIDIDITDNTISIYQGKLQAYSIILYITAVLKINLIKMVRFIKCP